VVGNYRAQVGGTRFGGVKVQLESPFPENPSIGFLSRAGREILEGENREIATAQGQVEEGYPKTDGLELQGKGGP